MPKELTNQRHSIRGGRQTLRHKQHEDRVGEEDGDAERHLFPCLDGQAECQYTQDVEPKAREQDVKHVVQDSALYHQDYRDVRVDGVADWINHLREDTKQHLSDVRIDGVTDWINHVREDTKQHVSGPGEKTASIYVVNNNKDGNS